MNKSQERIAANKREQRLNHMDSSLLQKKTKLRNNRNLSLPFEGDSSISCRRSIEIRDTKTDQTSIEETQTQNSLRNSLANPKTLQLAHMAIACNDQLKELTQKTKSKSLSKVGLSKRFFRNGGSSRGDLLEKLQVPQTTREKKLEGNRSSLPTLKYKKGFDSNFSSKGDLLSVRSRTDENVSNVFVTRDDTRSQRKTIDKKPEVLESRNETKTRTTSQLPSLQKSVKQKDLAELKSIIRTCIKERGTDILCTNIAKFNNSISQKMLQERFRNAYTVETADQIQELSYNDPRAVKWFFEHQRECIEESNLTRR